MVKPLPSRFNPDLLARDGTRFEAELPQEQFPRLSSILSSADNAVQATAGFSRRKDHIVISGRLATVFALHCQRCLEPFSVAIDQSFELVFVENQLAAGRLAKTLDPVILDENGQIHVVDLFEDELILHVPDIPKHQDETSCQLIKQSFGEVDEKLAAESEARPFEILKDLDIH